MKFIAISFERAVDALIEAKKLKIERLERKKEALIDIWLSLPQPILKHKRKEVFQILEGEDQIDLRGNEIVEKTEKGISIFASEEDLAHFYHSGFIDKLETLSKKNFDIKLLTSNSQKSRFFIEKIKSIKVKYTRSDVVDVPTFILADQHQLLLTIRKNDEKYGRGKQEIAALWTNYEAFVKALEKLFSELWSGEKSSIAVTA